MYVRTDIPSDEELRIISMENRSWKTTKLEQSDNLLIANSIYHHLSINSWKGEASSYLTAVPFSNIVTDDSEWWNPLDNYSYLVTDQRDEI